MRGREKRELSNEEFDAWMASCDQHEAVAAAADEEGGPRLSLVRLPEREEPAPTDLLPPPPPTPAAEPFDGVALPASRNRHAGWTAERQRLFLSTLAETGSIHLASSAARLTARSAYQLRHRSPAFAAAWDTAEQLAVGRLSALAFDRAIHGGVEQVWQEGELVAEKRAPNDRLLMWLLARLDPRRFAAASELRKDGGTDPQALARASFPAQLDAIADLTADEAAEE